MNHSDAPLELEHFLNKPKTLQHQNDMKKNTNYLNLHSFKAAFLFISALGIPVLTHAQLIIADTFDTADTTDVNADLASRQSGSIATTGWLTGQEASGTEIISSGGLTLGGGAGESNAVLDVNFADAGLGLLTNGAFKVSFDVNPGGSYATFSIGTPLSVLNGRPVVNSSTDFSLLMRSDNTGNVFAEAIDQGPTDSVDWSSGTVVLTVKTDSFSSGTAYTISMTVGGSVIDLNGAAAGNDFSGSWDADGTAYLYLSGRNAASTFDNFSVTAIPEPKHAGAWIGMLTLATLGSRKARKHRIR